MPAYISLKLWSRWTTRFLSWMKNFMQLEAFSKELFSFQIIARSCIVYTLLFTVCIDVFIAVVIIMFIIMIVIFIMMYIAHPLVHGEVCITVLFIIMVMLVIVIVIVIFIMMYIVMYIVYPLVHGEVCSGCEQPAISKLPLVDVEPDKIIIL